MVPSFMYLAVCDVGGVGIPEPTDEDVMEDRWFSLGTCVPSPFSTATGFHELT